MNQKYVTGDILMRQAQFGNTAPLKPGKYVIFPVLSLFFYLPLPRMRHSHPNKNALLKPARQGLLSHNVLLCYP